MSMIGVGVGRGDFRVLDIVHRQVPDASFPLDGLDDVAKERHVAPGVCLQLHISQLLQVP